MIFKLSKNNEFTIDKLLTIISYNTPFLRYLNEYIEVINEKIKRIEKKMEHSFQEIKKRDEAEYIKRVQKILEKSKLEEKNELSKSKKIFLNEENIKNADEQIKKISNEIKINDINSNINTLFLTPYEIERGKNLLNKNNLFDNSLNIFGNFNLVDFLNKKHNISQIKLSSSYKPKEEEKNNILNKKREHEDNNEYDKKAKDMKDITNNDLIFSKLKKDYEGTKNQIVSESEEESDESDEIEFNKNKNKRETIIQKKIREKEEKLKKFIKNNTESKYENEKSYKYKGKKRKK
jgi:hypothetical protein